MKEHVYKRSKGSWTIVYDLTADSITGKRRQKSQAVKGAKRDEQRVLRELLLSLENGSWHLVRDNRF